MARIGDVDKMSSPTTENLFASVQDQKKEQSDDREAVELRDGGSQMPSEKEEEDEDYYLTSWKLASVIIGLCLNVLCLSLDNTIITTAIPRITDHFQSLDDVGWYGSAYFLTTCAVTLVFGKLYAVFSTKWVYLSALFVFEVGSLICGATPTSVGLIVGRAIAGLGGGGILSGSVIIASRTVPLHKRPFYTGLIAAAYGIANVAGPLLGGALTDHASWRWCFYINLPVGVLPALCILVFYNPPPIQSQMTLVQKLQKLDLVANITFMVSVICLLLAIQWGGTRYHWNNARIIALFVLSGLLASGFAWFQWWKKDDATLPIRVLKKRGIWGSAWFAFFLGGSYYSVTYYLPVWFQAIRNQSATESGIMTLPLILTVTISSVLSGSLVTWLGYYNPFIIVGSIVATVGAGMLSTLKVGSGHSEWIGYQALYGIGVGLCVQLPWTIVQNVVQPSDIPIVTAFVTFIQTLGATISLAISQNVFHTFLTKNIQSQVPSVNPAVVADAGSTDVTKNIPSNAVSAVLHAYNDAIMDTFYISIAFAGLAVLGTLVLEWRSVRRKKIELALG